MYNLLLFLVLFNFAEGLSLTKRVGARQEKIVLERIEILEEDKRYIHAEARVNKINHTTYALSANYTIYDTFPDVNIKIDTFALFGNEYKKVPVAITRNICDVFDYELKWVEDDLKESHLPKKCPITKGNWYVKNYVPSNTNLPFVCPWDNLKLRYYLVQIKTKKNVFMADIFIKIDKTQIFRFETS